MCILRPMARLPFPLTALLVVACSAATPESSPPDDGPTMGYWEEPGCDCSGLPVTLCSHPVCDDGVCYLAHVPDGELADVDQVHGDCVVVRCYGLEAVTELEIHDAPEGGVCGGP